MTRNKCFSIQARHGNAVAAREVAFKALATARFAMRAAQASYDATEEELRIARNEYDLMSATFEVK